MLLVFRCKPEGMGSRLTRTAQLVAPLRGEGANGMKGWMKWVTR